MHGGCILSAEEPVLILVVAIPFLLFICLCICQLINHYKKKLFNPTVISIVCVLFCVCAVLCYGLYETSRQNEMAPPALTHTPQELPLPKRVIPLVKNVRNGRIPVKIEF